MDTTHCSCSLLTGILTVCVVLLTDEVSNCHRRCQAGKDERVGIRYRTIRLAATMDTLYIGTHE